jgi:hypothetical protein
MGAAAAAWILIHIACGTVACTAGPYGRPFADRSSCLTAAKVKANADRLDGTPSGWGCQRIDVPDGVPLTEVAHG